MSRLNHLLLCSVCLLLLIGSGCARWSSHSSDSNQAGTAAALVSASSRPDPGGNSGSLSHSDQEPGPLAASGAGVYKYQPDSSRSMGPELRLSEICKEAAGKVFYELKAKDDKHLTAKVAVVVAVPLSDFKRETEFGRLVAEYLLTDLADRGLQVTELRVGKEIHILPQTGEFIMSRNIAELANNLPILDYVVVTTYSNTSKTLILQGRLVSLQSGLVETSWRYTLPLERELLGLFNEREQPFTIAVKGFRQ